MKWEAMRRGLLSLTLILMAFAPSAIARQGSGWWVIIGSYPDDGGSEALLRKVSGAAARCGLESFNDTSGKFRGFQPGHMVFVVGPYPSRGAANSAAAVAKRCIPDAYVKWGEYAGE